MRRSVAPPVLVLIAIMVGVGLFLSITGRLVPTIVPDSEGYIAFPFSSCTAALSHSRTPGYPAFLQVARLVAPGWAAVPLLQYFFYCLGVATFYHGLRAACPSAWQRTAISGSLLFANILHGYVNTVATDTLAAAGAICVVGLLISRQISSGAQPPFWKTVVLGLMVLIVCLIRPAYLFLIAFVPLSGAMLTAVHTQKISHSDGRAIRQIVFREAAGLLGTVSVPVLAYCLLRLVLVGQFGLVSFGGYNLIGVAGQWLDEAVVNELPRESRPLAEAALEQRRLFQQQHPEFNTNDRMNYSLMELRYDDTIWRIFEPAAARLFEGENRRINTELRQLATALVKARPKLYAIWLAKAARQAVKQTASDFVTNPVYLLLIFGWIGTRVITSLCRRSDILASEAGSCDAAGLKDALFNLVIMYGATKLLLVILVCPPIGRMTDASAVFLPILLITTWGRCSSKALHSSKP